MKRLIIALIAAMVTLAASAVDPVKILSGSKAFLKENAKTTLLLNWDDAYWMDKGLMKKELSENEFKNYVNYAVENFINGFNSTSKKVKIDSIPEKADYEMVLVINKIDYFFSVTSVPPGYKYTLWGTLTVLNKDGGKVIEVEFDRFKGGRDFYKEDSFKKLFYSLGKSINKL